jgi:hypothetical protein
LNGNPPARKIKEEDTMIGKDRGRRIVRLGIAALAVGFLGAVIAQAQAPGRPGRSAVPAAGAASKPQGQPQTPEVQGRLVRVPVNPTDAVAIVNGESITRQQLSDECVAQKGQEILQALIARKLLDQAIRAKHITITAAEVDAEIDRVATTVAGIPREAWLRELAKAKGISPVQYARDIIYPGLALRKLAEPLVQITDEDLTAAYEANFGEKIRCRMIMVAKQRDGMAIWEEVKKNPASFEKIARDDPRSIDQATKPFGGLLPDPLSRHAHPRDVSDAIFKQLVDGDPDDQDAKHKPKDGDISGLIQVTEATWVIVKREGVTPPRPYDKHDPIITKQIQETLKEALLKDQMAKVYDQLASASAIENRLTGTSKKANEEKDPDFRTNLVDGQVKKMGQDVRTPVKGQGPAKPRSTVMPPTTKAGRPRSAPVGVSAEELKKIEEMKRDAPAPK